MGRPSDYNETIATEICQHIASGGSLAAFCREEGRPDYKTVMRWLLVHESFSQNYVRAREEQGNASADAIEDIAQRVLSGELDPQAARVAIDALKWSAGRRLPKKYGDKVQQEISGPDGGPVAITTVRIVAGE